MVHGDDFVFAGVESDLELGASTDGEELSCQSL